MSDFIVQYIDNAGADLLFALIVLTSFACVMLFLMFAGLALRAAFNWLTRRSWNDVIVYAERKALRGK